MAVEGKIPSGHRTALKVEDSSEDEDIEGGCKL